MNHREPHNLDYEPPTREPRGGLAVLALTGVTLVNGFITAALSCLGVLGFTGRLSDTSRRENVLQGIGILVMAVAALVWSAACFVALWERTGVLRQPALPISAGALMRQLIGATRRLLNICRRDQGVDILRR
jgi:hypothetical protein